MLRVGNLQTSINFYTKILGMHVLRTLDNPEEKYTLVFLGFDEESSSCVIELTYNYGVSSYQLGSAFGHIAIEVNNCFKACEEIALKGGNIIRKAGKLKGGDEIIAFVLDPDGYKIELIQRY